MTNFQKHKKVLGLVLLISLSLSILSCKTNAPQPPVGKVERLILRPQCEEHYLYYTDGAEIVQRTFLRDLPIEPSKPEDIRACIDLNYYTALMRYQKDMTKWVSRHCK